MWKENVSLPKLKPSERIREYNYYSDELKAKVIFEHLVNNKTHRWMDKNILKITSGNTNGRNSANILYYLGMKADYRGLFKDYSLKDVIKVLEDSGILYKDTVRLLGLLDIDILEDTIKQDLDAELAEEGNSLEGSRRRC